jgi:hypothetical protein
MVEPDLLDLFPRLRGRSYQITSPRDQNYNCIAFAESATLFIERLKKMTSRVT